MRMSWRMCTGVSSIPTRENEMFNIFIFFALVTRPSAALSFATHHTMLLQIGAKWGTEYSWFSGSRSAYPTTV